MPLLSIITCSLNNDKTISSTLRSVQNQTSVSIEHIVIDGGSSDQTLKILTESQFTNVNLIFLSEPDTGISDAMNKGIQRAKGDWLLFLHADDFLCDPTSIASIIPCLDDQSCIITTPVIIKNPNASERIWEPTYWRFKTRFKTTIPHQGAFIPRHLFDKLGMYDTRYKICMDYEWFFRAYRAKIPVKIVDIPVSKMNATGVSFRTDWQSLLHRFSEEKRIHFQHAASPTERCLYHAWWSVYPTYRRIRYFLNLIRRK